MIEISIYRSLVLPFYCSPSSYIFTVNQSRFCPVYSTACACYCLFFVWSSPSKPPFLVSSSPSITLWSLTKIYFTSPTWLFAVETQIVSSFHRLLSPLWFLNWKYSWVPPSVRRNPLFYKLDTTLLQQTLLRRAPTKTPVPAGPSFKKNLFFLFLFYHHHFTFKWIPPIYTLFFTNITLCS